VGEVPKKVGGSGKIAEETRFPDGGAIEGRFGLRKNVRKGSEKKIKET